MKSFMEHTHTHTPHTLLHVAVSVHTRVTDLQGDFLFGHGSLHRFIHLCVLDAEAAEDSESLQELLVIPVESLHAV